MVKQNPSAGKRILIISLLAVLTVIVFYFLFIPERKKEVNSGIAVLSKTFTGHKDKIRAVKFSPLSNIIASASNDSSVLIWQPDGIILKKLRQPEGITSLAFSADGNFLITGSYDQRVRLWNVNDGTIIKEFSGHKGTVWTVAFSPDGKTIASAGEDKTIKLWNIESGALLHSMTGHTLNIWSVRFSPDGTKIASGSFDNTANIWNVAEGKLIKKLAGHSEAVVDVAWSPDGISLATGSDDKTINIWNVATGKVILTLDNESHDVYAVTFSADGKRLLTGSRDKANAGEIIQNFVGESNKNKGISMRLWEVASGKLLQTFADHTNDVNDVDYSADGKWIISGSEDNTVLVYRVVR
jgi:WD40 repeat protein